MIYPAYKLNKQGDNIQIWHTGAEIGRQYNTLRPQLLLFNFLFFFSSSQVSLSIFVPISRHSEERHPCLDGHKTFGPRTRQSLTSAKFIKEKQNKAKQKKLQEDH